ncbi:hypothetical protein [Butyricimonas paravirosa]
MMRKQFIFLVVSLIFILASCVKEQDFINNELEEPSLFTRSYDEPIIVPCEIPRLKTMLTRALGITKDSTLTAIFTEPGRVEYAVITGQKNNIYMQMRPSNYRPQFTIYVSDKYYGLTNNGAIFVVIHELFHIYRYNKGVSSNDGDHEAMTGSYVYRDWVGDALGLPQYSYVQDYLVYCGTYGSPVYGKLSSGEKEKIRLLCESYGLPI